MHQEICDWADVGLVLALTGAIAAVGCVAATPALSPIQELLVGQTKQEVLACAGPPLSTVRKGEATILSYYKECPAMERSFFGTKGSVPVLRHGCRALVTLEGDRVAEVRYEPTPGGGVDHCEEIFVQCVR